MITVFNHCDVDIEDIAFFQWWVVVWNAVANHMVYRSTNGFRKTMVVKRRRNRTLLFGIFGAEVIELIGGHARFNMRRDHF